jgi:undecaprenyl-diphosphatase
VWFRGFRVPMVRITDDYKIAWLVIIGTIPIAVLGLLFEDSIQTVGRNLYLIATTLIVFGLLLGLAEKVGRQQDRAAQDHAPRTGSCSAFAQAMALIPGRLALGRHDHRRACSWA